MSLAKLRAAAAVDPSKERGGVWAEYTPDGVTMFRIKLAFAGGSNDKYMKRAEEITRPFRRSGVDIETLVVTKQREISGSLFAETIVVDWNADDFEAPFSVEACKEAFNTDPNLLAFCVKEAGRQTLYRASSVEADAGN